MIDEGCIFFLFFLFFFSFSFLLSVIDMFVFLDPNVDACGLDNK